MKPAAALLAAATVVLATGCVTRGGDPRLSCLEGVPRTLPAEAVEAIRHPARHEEGEPAAALASSLFFSPLVLGSQWTAWERIEESDGATTSTARVQNIDAGWFHTRITTGDYDAEGRLVRRDSFLDWPLFLFYAGWREDDLALKTHESTDLVVIGALWCSSYENDTGQCGPLWGMFGWKSVKGTGGSPIVFWIPL